MSNPSLSEATREALAKAPCSIRKLADAAGIPHSTLVRIQQGVIGASPQVVSRLRDALLVWATECDEAAKELDRELTKWTTKGGAE